MTVEKTELLLRGKRLCVCGPVQIEELNDKEQRLRMMLEEQDRSSKIQLLTQEKVRKDIEAIKKQLTHERTLKLDAFHRVDELQSQVRRWQ